MESDDDFTFCQVGVPVDEDSTEGQKVIPDVSSLNINDESSKSVASDQSSGIMWNNKLSSNATSERLGKIGSLTFRVIDTLSPKNLNDAPKQAGLEVAGSSVKTSQERKTALRKPVTRAKVPFQIGYSHMDWLKVTQTQPDLAGLKGQSNKRFISLNEVKQHQAEGSMWTVLKGCVYSIAPYMKFHPGGVDMLMKAVGKDCTSLFNKYHAWVNAEVLLEKCLVGTLDDSK